MPRHFRSFRGSRRRRLPGDRSVKFIVDQAGASESSGLVAITIAKGVDNIVMGQTTVSSVDVPTGSKIVQFDIRMPKVSLASGASNFINWSIQRTRSGQSVVNPATMGGNPLRRNVMLSGLIGLGEGQNNSLHVIYKVPKTFQRVADGDVWNIVNNNANTVFTAYQFMYKVWQ